MIKKLFLDLNNFKANLGSVERGDSIELNIKLLDSEDYSRSKFRVLGAKADGKYVEQIEGINLEEKDLKIVLEDQFVNCEGIVKLELNVVSGEIEITTKEFYFFVSNTMNAEIIDSADSIPTLEKVSKYVDDAVNNLDALKEASEDITIINSEFKENEIKRKANELLRERSEKERVRLESIRTTEEADRIKAEAERKEAENNRKVAESNRKLAENTRKTNEAARVEAELNRQSLFEENEEIRNENENLRIEAEKERKLAFSNNNKFESERVEAEKLRGIAEDKRVTAEKARANAEEERIKAETRRENTYTDFNDSEVERKNNEANRVRAETERVKAESGRNELFNTNEEKRNSTFIESERARERAFNEAQSNRNEAYEESERVREEAFKVSEAARDEAEEGRVEAESERVKSEKARVLADEERNTTFTQKEEERNNTFTQNETNRNTTFTQSEEERKTTFEEAENARKVAESKRVKAESSRVEAEKLRVAAETGRVEAESLRVTAEEERVAAETKREEGFNKFEGKINANTKELKNARSATTGEKFNTLDERIDCEVDRLNKKIEVSFLHQEDKESHDINNTVEGVTTDMVVKGKTLVNIVKSNRRICKKGASAYFQLIYPKLKTGKYTVILNASELTKEGITMYDMISSVQYPYNLKTGLNIRKIDVREEGSTYAVIVGNDNVDGTQFMLESLMILEGDWTNKPIPEYFESIKSFGQQEDKISILSYSNNLFDYKTMYSSWWMNSSGALYKDDLETKYSLLIPLYNLSPLYLITPNKDRCIVGFLDENDTVLAYYNLDTNTIKVVTPKPPIGTKKVLIYLKTTGYDINKDNGLMVSYNDTQFEPHQSDKKDILLSQYGFDEGLRGFDLTVYDELNSIRNVTIKRIEKLVINDINISEIQDRPNAQNTNWFQTDYISNTTIKTGGLNINNKLIGVTEGQAWADSNDFECLSITGTNSGARIKGRVNKGVTSEQLKERLKGLIVYYELAEPVETPLDESINLKVFNEKTYISFENAMSGTSSFKAPVDSAATISRLNRENRALEEENKTLRQDFESTTLSLTDSDLELVKQNVDIDFRLMEVEFALDIPQSTLCSNINFKNKKGEVKNMARTPYEMMKIVILSGDYDREDYIHKVGKYYERGRMTKEEYDELMSLMTADEVISK
ncbi:TPA: hypothetical protein K8N09_000269 [Clostridium perfringens]|nr:hypothetical protein [Clostridium perfringens]